MRKIFTFCILLLFAACVNTGTGTSDIELLNQRITRLEQRIDSLVSHGNINSVGEIGRCQAITKKGTQCKRTAKNNGYCWQHRR